jgi:hypothetical protein
MEPESSLTFLKSALLVPLLSQINSSHNFPFPICKIHFNYAMLINKIDTFKIDVLIHFVVSSTCFEHHVFMIRNTICTCSFLWYVFHVFM